MGNSDGSLKPAVLTANSTPYFAYTVGDLNHDGYSDIAIGTSSVVNTFVGIGKGSVQTLLGGPSGFTAGPTFTFPTSQGTRTLNKLYVAETRNSGLDTDLAIEAGFTTILLGDGEAHFTEGRTYAFTTTATFLSTLTPTLFNIGASTGTTFSTLPGNGDGTFQGPTAAPIGFNPVTADFNHDGLTDALTTDANGNLEVLLSQGNGLFTTVSSTVATAGPSYLLAADLNGDGNADAIQVLISDGSSLNVKVFVSLGNGDGTLGAPLPAITLNVSTAWQPYLGDFDGDGKLDLLIPYKAASTSPNLPGILVLLGNGDGTFKPPMTVGSYSSTSQPSTVVGDINGDGKTDFVLNESIYLSTGSGNFTVRPHGLNGVPTQLIDMDGDGYADLILSGGSNGIYLGQSDGTFQTTRYFALAAGTLPTAEGYVNGDNLRDLMVYYGQGNVYVAGGGGVYTEDPNPVSGVFGTFGTFNTAGLPAISNRYQDFFTVLDGAAVVLFNTRVGSGLSKTTTTLQNSIGVAAQNQIVTLTATVAGAGATGIITFSTPNATLGTATLNNSGVATLTVSFSAIGSYTITASYGGDSHYLPNNSNSTIVIVKSSTTTKVSVSPTVAAANQSVTFTATVTGASPTGTVVFQAITAASTLPLGNATLDSSGVATLTYSFPVAATYAIVAGYAGDNSNLASQDTGTLAVTTSTTTTLTSSLSSANENQSITLTATVAPAGGTGNVTFSTASTTLGTAAVNSSGVATLATLFATPGTYSITATYAGDSLHVASTSSATNVTVVAPSFTLAASPNALTISRGQSGTSTITLTPSGGYTGTVNLSCGTLPSEATCNFSPAALTVTSGAVSSTLNFSTTAPSAKTNTPIGIAGLGLGLLCLLAGARKRKLQALAVVLFACGAMLLNGCGGSSGTPKITNPGTPLGTQTVVVTAAGTGSGAPSTTLFLQITIQ